MLKKVPKKFEYWPSSKFLNVKCHDCMNEQIIFNKANTFVKCLVCGSTLAIPKGGKARVKCKVLSVVDSKYKKREIDGKSK